MWPIPPGTRRTLRSCRLPHSIGTTSTGNHQPGGEHHYLAWKQLAEELGLPCPPERKDQVRGISRAEALKIVLAERWEEHEGEVQELMARKDAYYRELIEGLSPQDLLPGVRELLEELKSHRIKVAVATVFRNGKTVLSRLGILDEFDAIVDGHSGARSKPAPDLFLYAAARLGVPGHRGCRRRDRGGKGGRHVGGGLGPKGAFPRRAARPRHSLPHRDHTREAPLDPCGPDGQPGDLDGARGSLRS